MPGQPFTKMPGHLIRRLNQTSTAYFQERISAAGFDLTSVQFAAMSAIADNPGIDQATLASLISYDRATIGGVVDRLIRKGLVARQVNRNDRRARLLLVTKDGAGALEAIGDVVLVVQDDILANLTPTERKTFMRLAVKALDGNPPARRA